MMEDNTDSVNTFFGKATDLYEKSKNFRKNAIILLLCTIIVKQTSGVLNLKKEQKVFDFFRCLRILSPQVSMCVSANCELEGKAVFNW